MKDFLKFTLASLTGVILAGIIVLFIGIATFVGIAASSETETIVEKNAFMFLELNGELLERSEEQPFKQLLGENMNSYGLEDILSSIKKAKNNENIKGIYIQANYLETSFASLEEIRNALIDFKESGKFLVTYADNYTQGLYYLSSVADKVILNPQGAVEWKGLASHPMFYKNMLEKLGIEVQIFKVGTYKSAVEPFINTEMSPANREQVMAYANSIWSNLLKRVSESRNIPVKELNQIADEMLMFYSAEKTLQSGLVDTLLYKDGVRNYLKQLTGQDQKDGLNALELSDMINVKKEVPKDKSGNIIAVYYAYGDIDGLTDEGIVSKKVVRDLRKLREDENVKAVVLRVNSPGGSAFGSEQIWREVSLIKQEKPVIVSMGDYAASGGYYISCAADVIIAQPTTLTGSIGIFGMVPDFSGLTNKVGLDFDVAKTNKYADFGTFGRGLNNDEKSLIQMSIEQGYRLFLTRCANGRNLTLEEIEKIAEGRVWTGEMAKELGLVDELGGLDKAIRLAEEKSQLESYSLISYPEKKSFFMSLLENQSTGIIEAKMRKEFGEFYSGFSLIKSLENKDYIQARVPFELNIR